jgi:hypothetical protein
VAGLAAAAMHFLLTRLTDYPQGTWKLIPFPTHAFVELGEGVAILVAAALLGAQPAAARVFLAFMGSSQLTAFSFSCYRPPPFSDAR